MPAESKFTQDWLQNWQAKIAVRITSVIIWSLSFTSMLIAGVLISQVRDNVETSQNIITDHFSFQLQQKIQHDNNFSFEIFDTEIQHIMQYEYIHAIVLKNKNEQKTYGKQQPNDEMISRVLLMPSPLKIIVYTPPINEIVRSKQIEIFMQFSFGIILLGGFIGLVIDKSVQKPFLHLEKIAQQYTSGRHTARANADREDEFGTLALFLNKMLDRISLNEQHLQDEVKERTFSHQKIKQQRDALQQLTNELTLARDQANDANDAKTLFLANMSHELRTPLNAVIGYSELIKEAPDNQENKQLIDDINKILHAGKHLLRLINQILDISRIETGKMQLQPEATAIASLLGDVCSTLKPAIKKQDNTLTVEVDDQIKLIHIDPTRIKQILFNLIDNANKFTCQGEIKISLQNKTEQLFITVQDNGIGIAENKLQHIFEEFVQADISTTRRYGGTGLGLSICRHLVQLMGGKISVSSHLEQGSIFTVVIPIIEEKIKDVS